MPKLPLSYPQGGGPITPLCIQLHFRAFNARKRFHRPASQISFSTNRTRTSGRQSASKSRKSKRLDLRGFVHGGLTRSSRKLERAQNAKFKTLRRHPETSRRQPQDEWTSQVQSVFEPRPCGCHCE